MVTRTSVATLLATLALSAPCLGAGLWHPQPPGTAMTEHLYKVDGTHRSATWADHAGFVMAVDAAGVYDNWRTVDDAPQVRISFDDTSVDLGDEDFAVTVRTQLQPGYGDRFHAGLCIVFGTHDLLVWGPHGSTNLRLRRPDGVDVWQTFPGEAAFLKLKRRGDLYEAWSSADGKNWALAGSTTITADPIAVGTILKTWSIPHAETVDFDYFELTNVQNEPAVYIPNTRYGDTDVSALRFVYELSGVEILLRVFVNDDGLPPEPEDTTLYLIHGSGDDDSDGCYDAILTYQRIATLLEAGGHPNMVVVALRFLRNNCPNPGDTHPYGYPLGWGYQNLEGEDDRILMDVHEDYARTRFPAATPGADERFYMLGHSGGGQYVTRFAMGHSDKLIRAVASSPWGTAFPTGEYEWPFGTYLPADFRAGNPRFSVDLAGASALPLAVIVGENDNELDRSWEDVAVVARSRFDNAMKWVRQMSSQSIKLYIVPEREHWFSPPKREIAMAFLFGDPSPYDHLLYSSPYPDFQDVEDHYVMPFVVPENLPHYFHFDRFLRDVRRLGFADRRYGIAPGGLCFSEDVDGSGPPSAWVTCSLVHTAGELKLTIDDFDGTRHYGGIWAHILYGRVRMYSTDAAATYMLEQSPAPTPAFIQDVLIGLRLNLFECTGRGPDGPECGPFPAATLQLNADHSVTDPDTGMPPGYQDIRSWSYEVATRLLRFKNSVGSYVQLRIGDWRWGMDDKDVTFLAGLQTNATDGVPRRELQTNAIYNPRYFEEWDVAHLDYDGDGVVDIEDNCPVTNGPQTDSDGDGLGDVCDPTPVPPPASVDARDGADVGKVTVSWDPAPGASHYRVYRSLSSVPGGESAISSWQAGTLLNDLTVTPGVDYYYSVRSAVSASGDGASELSTSDAGWAALAAPAGVTASDGTVLDAVHVSWPAVAGAQAYRVYSNATGTLPAAVLSPWQPATAYDDSSPAPGETRYYWVEASPYAAGGRTSALGGPDSGWYLLAEIFVSGFEDGGLLDWSGWVP